MIYIGEDWKTLNFRIIRKDYYEVSNCGRIRRKSDKKIMKVIENIDENKYSKISLDVDKYINHQNGYKTRTRRSYEIHQLVFVTFGSKEDIQTYLDGVTTKKIVINHKNGKKYDNNINNLEIVTPSENTRHAIKLKLFKIGSDSVSSYNWINDDIINSICRYLDEGLTTNEIAKRVDLYGYGCNENQITQLITSIYNGRRWKHIAKNYNFFTNKTVRSRSHSVDEIKYVCHLLETTTYTDAKIAKLTLKKFNKENVHTFNSYKNFVYRLRIRESFQNISKDYKF